VARELAIIGNADLRYAGRMCAPKDYQVKRPCWQDAADCARACSLAAWLSHRMMIIGLPQCQSEDRARATVAQPWPRLECCHVAVPEKRSSQKTTKCQWPSALCRCCLGQVRRAQPVSTVIMIFRIGLCHMARTEESDAAGARRRARRLWAGCPGRGVAAGKFNRQGLGAPALPGPGAESPCGTNLRAAGSARSVDSGHLLTVAS
jgi:hypothetical protein